MTKRFKMINGVHRGANRGLRVAVLASLASTCLAGAAHADWTKDILDARCADEQREKMGESLRNNIEESVRRAEASIQAPTAVGDLGCLNDLMTLPLDTFSQVGGLLTSLTAGMGDISLSGLNLDIDVAGAVCGLAAEKWAELTKGLNFSSLSLQDMGSLSATASERIASGLTMDFPSFTGSAPAQDSSGYSGSIADYTPPSTAVSPGTAALPIYPGYSEPAIDLVAMQAAEDAAWAENMRQLAGYVGCKVSQNLNGTTQTGGGWGSQTWYTLQNPADCTFTMSPTPVWAFSTSTDRSTIQAAPAPQSEQFGQPRPEQPEAAGQGAPTSGNPIWDALGQ